MRALAQCDGHDPPRLVNEPVPCLAALVDEIVVGFEDQLESQLSRMHCQTFSTGLSSGDFGGRAMMAMFGGMTRRVDMCHTKSG